MASDADIAEKDHLWMDTYIWLPTMAARSTIRLE